MGAIVLMVGLVVLIGLGIVFAVVRGRRSSGPGQVGPGPHGHPQPGYSPQQPAYPPPGQQPYPQSAHPPNPYQQNAAPGYPPPPGQAPQPQQPNPYGQQPPNGGQ
ncbi:hypothetical protein [Streptomyces sp. NPDC046859]|uniref:hypothetical protein n=1 Tax=Streptomyces sp. NPDC046859 TaxID=3155734 RepID=UPI0033EB9C4C